MKNMAIPVTRKSRQQIPGSTSFTFSNSCKIAILLGLALNSAASVFAQYDPSAQFSSVSNPDGVWSYGTESVPLGSPFSLLPINLTLAASPLPIDAWEAPAVGELGVFDNGTPLTETMSDLTDNAIYQSGMLAMHPGPNGEYAIVQFTAPANGIYTFQGVFEGIDTSGTTTDVHLLVNNAVVASGNAVGYGPTSDVPLSFGPVLLNLGQTLAYAVGDGGNGSAFDTTALINAQVEATAVPEPSSFGLFALATAGFVLRHRSSRTSARA